MSFVSLTMVSGNQKVGPIPVTTSDRESCPSECSLKGLECYAEFGPLRIHWNKIGNGRGDNFEAFCERIKKLPKKQLWRHNQAGDLSKDKKGRIDKKRLMLLAESCKHTKGYTYTHYNPFDSHNAKAIKEANDVGGLVINLSADTPEIADSYVGIAPVVCILPKNVPRLGNKTPKGIPIVVCPAQTNEDMTCSRCQLCQNKDRKSIIGFLAHGSRANMLSERVG